METKIDTQHEIVGQQLRRAQYFPWEITPVIARDDYDALVIGVVPTGTPPPKGYWFNEHMRVIVKEEETKWTWSVRNDRLFSPEFRSSPSERAARRESRRYVDEILSHLEHPAITIHRNGIPWVRLETRGPRHYWDSWVEIKIAPRDEEFPNPTPTVDW